jgi:Uma2 family endonuclease
MRTVHEVSPDFHARLGNIPADRIRANPLPGTATEADVLEVHRREGVLCELIDGALVQKPPGFRESVLACALIEYLGRFNRTHRLGVLTGPSGMVRLRPGLVRSSDAALAFWHRFPDRQLPTEPIPGIAPDLAVDVLRRGNTNAEIVRKRGEYFRAGARLVWIVDPNWRTVTASASADANRVLTEDQTLDGGDVLLGFALPLRELFTELDRRGQASSNAPTDAPTLRYPDGGCGHVRSMARV